MGYQSSWTGLSFAGVAIMAILAFFDLFVFFMKKHDNKVQYDPVAMNSNYQTPVQRDGPQKNFLKQLAYFTFYILGWAFLAVALGELLYQTTSNSITSMSVSALQAEIGLTFVFIPVTAFTAGLTYACLRSEPKKTATVTIVVSIMLVLYGVLFGFLIYFLVVACAGIFQQYAYVTILVPLGEPWSFVMKFRDAQEPSWVVWVSLIPRCMTVIGYVFMTISMNNMI